MYRRPTGYGWGALTPNQKIGVVVVGILVLYAFFSGAGGSGFLGRLGDPSWILAAAAIVLVAFPVHEMAHAAAAVALGDPTPRWQGRFTLNPMAHIDPMGAVLLFLTGFGWARPVEWNPRNLEVDRRLGMALVALAGPASNLVLAGITVFLLPFLPEIGRVVSGPLGLLFFPGGFLFDFLQFFVFINTLLFVFNLLPIPPLDGSHILFALLPASTRELQAFLAQYGLFLLILFIFLGGSVLVGITSWVMRGLYGLLL